jgi:hypothetical protein
MTQQSPYPWIRPPAVPLITHDPYFSIWSMKNKLTGGWSRHWTDEPQAMLGIAILDGQPYRFMGRESDMVDVPNMEQISLAVWPLRTVYTFQAPGLLLTLTFTSPLLPDDLDLVGRPVSYLTFDVQSTDGLPHKVQLFFSITGAVAAENHQSEVVWSRHRMGNLGVLSSSAADQRLLNRSGDDLRIEWGRLLLAAPLADADLWTGYMYDGLAAVLQTGSLPEADDIRMPRSASDEHPHLVCLMPVLLADSEPVSRVVMLAYDEQFSIEYLYRKLRPYWRRGGMEIGGLLRKAWEDYPSLVAACRKFDHEVMAMLTEAGGEHYAVLCALAYRQTMAAHKLVYDHDGTPMLFSKENFSNGCAATVDVTYPSSPFFLLFNPMLLRAMLNPVMQYVVSGRWRFPFAPHDVGRYPLANGQVYGGGERREENQMPVEESGNMLIMLAALTRVEKNTTYIQQYWPVINQWAEYLRLKGLDPENQLCTDDFTGYLAHNTNLSLKAIIALACFAEMAGQIGEQDTAQLYRGIAESMAQEWMTHADDGDHYRLAFNKPGTWSQKYNLVWDRLLGLNLFPPEVARKEVSFYLARQNRYGLPLDNRESYTKLDWIAWSATLAEIPADFLAMVLPLYHWAGETTDRVPLTDWYDTLDGQQEGFRARSVVGGLYIKALSNAMTSAGRPASPSSIQLDQQ